MTPPTPIIPIRPEVTYKPPENYDPPELKIVVKKEKTKFCPHDYIEIFQYHRVIMCADCGETLDPFSYLLMVGQKEGNTLSHLKILRLQVKRLQDEHDRLKHEISKLKMSKRKSEK